MTNEEKEQIIKEALGNPPLTDKEKELSKEFGDYLFSRLKGTRIDYYIRNGKYPEEEQNDS